MLFTRFSSQGITGLGLAMYIKKSNTTARKSQQVVTHTNSPVPGAYDVSSGMGAIKRTRILLADVLASREHAEARRKLKRCCGSHISIASSSLGSYRRHRIHELRSKAKRFGCFFSCRILVVEHGSIQSGRYTSKTIKWLQQ